MLPTRASQRWACVSPTGELSPTQTSPYYQPRGFVDRHVRLDEANAALLSARAFIEEPIHDFLPVMEAGAFKAFERISEVEKISMGGHSENSQSSGHPESFAPRRYYAFTIVDQ